MPRAATPLRAVLPCRPAAPLSADPSPKVPSARCAGYGRGSLGAGDLGGEL